MDETSLIIGALGARLDAQNEKHNALASTVEKMDGKLDQLLANQQQQRGARKLAAWLGTGAGASAGAIIGWIITWKTGR